MKDKFTELYYIKRISQGMMESSALTVWHGDEKKEEMGIFNQYKNTEKALVAEIGPD